MRKLAAEQEENLVKLCSQVCKARERRSELLYNGADNWQIREATLIWDDLTAKLNKFLEDNQCLSKD